MKRSGRDFSEADFGLGGGARRRRRLIPDTPGVAIVSAVFTLALAVVLFIVSMPREEQVLVYEGREVGSSAVCETVGPDGETLKRACIEVAELETRDSGWRVPGVVIALVLAALAVVVLAGVPAQVRAARKERETAQEYLTDEDRKQSR